MPQLNPAPWFMTFIISWLILLIMLKPTMLQLKSPHLPTQPTTTDKTASWPWMWQ
uniref:ATP synthase complex subunit 8 n=1 Tax=Geckolepis petiti TaxID=476478 RepID=A0A7R7G1Z5_9SAUR|nr:ATPase subunit8 [Geckolepis petiti]